jgi:hypothetical protein
VIGLKTETILPMDRIATVLSTPSGRFVQIEILDFTIFRFCRSGFTSLKGKNSLKKISQTQ